MLTSKIQRRIACAISGGIDSAVTALLLRRHGYEVVGVHMVNWDFQEENQDPFSCPRTKDLADAKKLCDELNIELHIANFVKEYWNLIFENLLKNYRLGRTIVPDIDCNKHIKFDLLLKFITEKLGTNLVATGHFARTSQGNFLENLTNQKVKLLRAKDPLKDQTFFLSSLNHHQLRNIMFPIGSLYKSEIRQIADKAGLAQFVNKQESMGICFIGKKTNFDEFLSKFIDPVEGHFVDIETGRRLPDMKHKGVHNFTIGKRIQINGGQINHNSSQSSSINSTEALYVADVDANTQTVFVCQGYSHRKLYAKRIAILKPRWIGNDPDYVRKINNNKCGTSLNKSLQMSIQRTHSPYLCKIHATGKNFDSDFLEVEPYLPIRAAAPGQVCVFYSGEECLGCAEIDRVIQTL